MGMPTIYRTPQKNLPPQKTKAKDLRRWKKYRESRNRSTVRPPQKAS